MSSPDDGAIAKTVLADDLPSVFELGPVDLRRLLDPIVLRSFFGAIIAGAIALWPARTDAVLVFLIGAGLVVLGVTTGAAELRTRVETHRGQLVAWPLVLLVLGALLVAFTDTSIEIVSRISAIALTAYAATDFVRALRTDRVEIGLAWPIAKLLTLVTLALAMFAYPGRLLALVATLIAIGIAVIGALAVARSISSDEARRPESFATTGRLVFDWVAKRPRPRVDRRDLYERVLYEGDRLSAKLTRFAVLMFLAGLIAAGGVLTDSTAVVIGAMLIAPLMTPLMAVAISVVMGWPNRLARSALIVLGGVLLVIAIALVMGEVAPVTLDTATNTQIVSRSSPTILDLVIAVAAGAAGAYGLSRPDVSDALPGVAIAISLVPPLSVVGVALSAGSYDEATGALLLFVTNALAIIIVGGLTFTITGLTPLRVARANSQRVQTASAAILTLAVVTVVALGLNGREIASNAIELGRASSAVQRWLGSNNDNFSVLDVEVAGNTVTVTIIGPPIGAPSAEALQSELSSSLGRDVTTDLRVRVQTRDVIGPDGAAQSDSD